MKSRSALESPSGGTTEGRGFAGSRNTAGTRTCWPASSRALACTRLESSRTCPERSSFCRWP